MMDAMDDNDLASVVTTTSAATAVMSNVSSQLAKSQRKLQYNGVSEEEVIECKTVIAQILPESTCTIETRISMQSMLSMVVAMVDNGLAVEQVVGTLKTFLEIRGLPSPDEEAINRLYGLCLKLGVNKTKQILSHFSSEETTMLGTAAAMTTDAALATPVDDKVDKEQANSTHAPNDHDETAAEGFSNQNASESSDDLSLFNVSSTSSSTFGVRAARGRDIMTLTAAFGQADITTTLNSHDTGGGSEGSSLNYSHTSSDQSERRAIQHRNNFDVSHMPSPSRSVATVSDVTLGSFFVENRHDAQAITSHTGSSGSASRASSARTVQQTDEGPLRSDYAVDLHGERVVQPLAGSRMDTDGSSIYTVNE